MTAAITIEDIATVTSTAMTVEEFSRLPRDGARHEINAGELITLPVPKSSHSLTALAVLECLQGYLKPPDWTRYSGSRLCAFARTIDDQAA